MFSKTDFRLAAAISAIALASLLLLPVNSFAEILITEFMADNDSVIDDEDGDSSDWIELYNTGPGSVNLEGYFLTDDSANLSKWRIPAVTIAAEDFLLVFASEKDRGDPNAELHTNFRLSASGEYLALVAPDGATVLSDFAPVYPEQFEDVSYGLEQTGNTTEVNFLPSSAPCRRIIPTSSLGLTWIEQEFNDASWPAATTGIGYENGNGYQTLFGTNGDVGNQMSDTNTSAYIRIPFDVDDPGGLTSLTLDMKYDDGFIAYLNGVRVASQNGPQTADWNTAASGSNDDNAAVLFEAFDIIAHAGRLQQGANLLAIHGLNVSTGSSDFLILPEINGVRISDPSVGGAGYLDDVTPGTFNGPTFAGFVSDTTFSVDRGFYSRPIRVEITSETEGATIRWTTDGSDPTATRGNVYNGPIELSQTTENLVRGSEMRSISISSALPGWRVYTQIYMCACRVTVSWPLM